MTLSSDRREMYETDLVLCFDVLARASSAIECVCFTSWIDARCLLYRTVCTVRYSGRVG